LYHGRPDQPNTGDFPVFVDGERRDETRRTRYALHLPYSIVEHIDWGGADGMVYFFASQPVSANRCVGYCLVARNYNLDQPDEVMQDFERTIFGQDQRVVESQRPDHVPFDLVGVLARPSGARQRPHGRMASGRGSTSGGANTWSSSTDG
jgi:vanillate O-demethylase monooxygenase subunit